MGVVDNLTPGTKYPLSQFSEAERVELREALKARTILFDKEKQELWRTGSPAEKAPEPEPSLVQVAVSVARQAPNPAAAVAELLAFVWGYIDKPNWPLYGKFAKCFADRRDLAIFLLEKVCWQFEGNPVTELYPLAYARSGQQSAADLAVKRKEIADNQAEIRRLLEQNSG